MMTLNNTQTTANTTFEFSLTSEHFRGYYSLSWAPRENLYGLLQQVFTGLKPILSLNQQNQSTEG